jgi:hypothetical protein
MPSRQMAQGQTDWRQCKRGDRHQPEGGGMTTMVIDRIHEDYVKVKLRHKWLEARAQCWVELIKWDLYIVSLRTQIQFKWQ